MKKQCKECLQWKFLSQFEKKESNRDGRRNRCYVCRGKKKKTLLSYKRFRARKKKERYHNDPVYREKVLQRFRENKILHPEKVAAKFKVRDAIRAGKLVRQPCSCGNPKGQAHHEDYSKPLDVIWLCASCHMKLHYQKQTALSA